VSRNAWLRVVPAEYSGSAQSSPEPWSRRRNRLRYRARHALSRRPIGSQTHPVLGWVAATSVEQDDSSASEIAALSLATKTTIRAQANTGGAACAQIAASRYQRSCKRCRHQRAGSPLYRCPGRHNGLTDCVDQCRYSSAACAAGAEARDLCARRGWRMGCQAAPAVKPVRWIQRQLWLVQQAGAQAPMPGSKSRPAPPHPELTAREPGAAGTGLLNAHAHSPMAPIVAAGGGKVSAVGYMSSAVHGLIIHSGVRH